MGDQTEKLKMIYEFFVRCYRWILSTAHFAQEAAQDFCNQLYVFFGHTFNFIQLHSTDFIMNQNKSKQTIQAFNIVVTLGFKWYPCCAECFPELFWTKWNDTHGKLLQNGR